MFGFLDRFRPARPPFSAAAMQPPEAQTRAAAPDVSVSDQQFTELSFWAAEDELAKLAALARGTER